jgi:hypothetical protein
VDLIDDVCVACGDIFCVARLPKAAQRLRYLHGRPAGRVCPECACAREIIEAWFRDLRAGKLNAKGKAPIEWLRAAAKRSSVVHDTCDANVDYFEPGLRAAGLADLIGVCGEGGIDVWDAVMDAGRLEAAAADLLHAAVGA